MAKTRSQKVKTVGALEEGFKRSKLIVLSEIKGLNVAATTKLRTELRAEKIGHTVAKISLVKKALRKAGIKTAGLEVHTQASVTYSEDETAAARILRQFSRGHDSLKILCGYFNKELIDQKKLLQLATIPSRTELLGQLVGVIAGPVR